MEGARSENRLGYVRLGQKKKGGEYKIGGGELRGTDLTE